MIIRGGENVYWVEVEAAIFEHPAVADCAVVGVPHPILGEEVGGRHRAATRARSSKPRSSLATSPTRLAAFNVPTHFFFRNAAAAAQPRRARCSSASCATRSLEALSRSTRPLPPMARELSLVERRSLRPAQFSSRCASFDVPGIGSITG